MEQAVTRFSRAFTFAEWFKADVILMRLQSLLISHHLFRLKGASQFLWNVGRDIHIVDTYSWCDGAQEITVATIHRWKREGRVLFLSVVMGVDGDLASDSGELFSTCQFISGAHSLPDEPCPKGISGWHDLIAPGADPELVRFSVSPPSDAQPVAGGIATQ